MDTIRLERQFRGQARLIRLLLWKVGESTDVDKDLDAAVAQNMIDAADAAFLGECLRIEERDRDTERLGMDVTDQVVARLHRCADKLNRADAA